MGFDYYDLAARYGVREEPVLITDIRLHTKYVNRSASNLSVLQFNSDYLRSALTPASMQQVQRLRRTKKPVTFTQSFGKKYKESFRVHAEFDTKEYIVFSFYRPHGYSDEQPLSVSLADSNMNTALQQTLSLATLLKRANTSSLTTEQLADLAEKVSFGAMRCARQEQYKRREPICFAYHLPTLINQILAPCAKYLEEHTPGYKLHYHDLTGEGVVKSDAQLFRYILYSLMSTAIFQKHDDLTLNYTEYSDSAQLDIFSGKERPIIITAEDPETSQAVCESLGLSTAYLLMEKLQGELNARWLADGGLMFSLKMPTAYVEGAFKEHLSTQLEEQISTLKIEFSIL